MKFTIVSPTTIFKVSSRIALIFFIYLFTSLFVPIPFLAQPLTTYIIYVGMGFAVVNVFCKKYNDIGTVSCYADGFEIDYQNGVNMAIKIDHLDLLKVEVVSYWGGRVGLSVMPHHGSSNSIHIVEKNKKTRIYFRIESREDRERAYNFMKKWTDTYKNVKVAKGLF